MRCATCDAENGSKAKFCRRCGAGLASKPVNTVKEAMKRCGDCKIVVPGDSQFCNQCGGSLAEQAEAAAAMPVLPALKRFKPVAAVAMALAVMGLAIGFVHLVGGSVTSIPLQAEADSESAVTPAAASTSNANVRPAQVWLAALRSDLQKCEGESVFSRPFCKEKAKFKHCRPNRWGTVDECPKADLPDESTL